MKNKVKSIISKVLTGVMICSLAISTVPINVNAYTDEAGGSIGMVRAYYDGTYTATLSDLSYTDNTTYISVSKVKSSVVSANTGKNIILPGTLHSENANADVPVKYSAAVLVSLGNNYVTLGQGSELTTTNTNVTLTGIEFEEGVKVPTLTSLFYGWSNLETVVGFGNVIAGYAKDVTLDCTFENCTSLETIDIDLSDYSNSVTFKSTFAGCTSLSTVNVSNGSVKSVDNMFYLADAAGLTPLNCTATFDTIDFPATSSEYLSYGFTKFAGVLNFKNCTSSSASKITLENAFRDSERAGGDIEINVDGSDVESLENMFENASYGTITFGNNIVTNNTKSIVNVFESATVTDIVGLDNWTIGECKIQSAFNNTTFKDEETAKAAINDFKSGNTFENTTDGSLTFAAANISCVDYSGTNMSEVALLSISQSAPTEFISASVQPTKYNISSTLFYQDDESKATMNGYGYKMVNTNNGYIFGSDIEADTYYTTLYATINMHNVGTNTDKTYFVEGGHKISDYVGTETTYYTTDALNQKKNTNLSLANGSTVDLYYSSVEVGDDLDEGITYKFNKSVSNITAYTKDSNTSRKLVDDGTTLTVYAKASSTPDTYKTLEEFEKYGNIEFYDIGMTINDGTDHEVDRLNDTVQITMPLPSGYQTGDSIAVYNWHDGIDSNPTQVTSSVSGKNLVITTSQFSDYAVVYGDAEEDTTTITINWKNEEDTSSRPRYVEFSYVAEYEDGTTDRDTFNVLRDTSKTTQTYDLTLLSASAAGERTSLVVTCTTPDGYTLNKSDSAPYTFNFLYGDDDTLIKYNITIVWNDKGYESDRPSTFEYMCLSSYDSGTVTEGIGQITVVKSEYTMERSYDLNSYVEKYGNLEGFYFVPYSSSEFIAKDPDGYISTWDESTKTLTLTNVKLVPGSDISYVAKFEDTGHESSRPDGIILKFTSSYNDGTVVTKYMPISQVGLFENKYSFNGTTKVLSKNGSATLTGTTVTAMPVTGYTLSSDTDTNTFTYTYGSTSSSTTTKVTYVVNFSDTGNTDKRPSSVGLTLTSKYSDDSTLTKNVTVSVSDTTKTSFTGETTVANKNGTATLVSTEVTAQAVNNYTLATDSATNTFTYTYQSGATTGTIYFAVNFKGYTSTGVVPTTVELPCTVKYADGTTENKTCTITVTNGAGSGSVSYSLTNSAGSQFQTLSYDWPTLTGWNQTGTGLVAEYTYTGSTSGSETSNTTKATYTIKFDDSTNKAGRRPETLTITLADTTTASNTVTDTLTISNPTTTTDTSYTGSVTIPEGTTYAVTGVATLPSGYTATYSGLTATLKYTPETINKTYKVEWKGDGDNGDNTRPSSVSITLKSGDTEYSKVTASEDTNWSVTATLDKYLKGVEAAYTPTADTVSNYSSSVSGTTITYTFTGTLTTETAAVEAANSSSDGTSATTTSEDETEDDLYNYDMFDWIDYANKYPDLKKAYGYNKEKLYAHYIHYGIAEGRIATFTGKYANVNEDILAAYFPEDYQYKVTSTDSEYTLGSSSSSGSSVSGNSTDTGTTEIIQNDDGTTTVRVKNADGTTTETILDADGNVVSTRTYKTGDMRLSSVGLIVLAIVLLALAIAILAGVDFKKEKKRLTDLFSQIDVMKV
jgi:hypothetical protein